MTNVFNPAELPLGAIPSPNDPRTLRLENFLMPTLPEPPQVLTFEDEVPNWPMMGNDLYGDCVWVAHGHFDQLTSDLAGTPNVATDQEVISRYLQHTGGVDRGTVPVEMLRELRKVPFEDKRILGFCSIDPRNHRLMKQAIAMFRGVYRGVMLPKTAQAQSGPTGLWAPTANPSDPNAAPNSWGPHMTLDVGYDTTRVKTVTWGYVQPASYDFYTRYSMEAWCVIPMYPVPGFDYPKFVAALQEIGSNVDFENVPDPVPPVPGDETDYEALQRILGSVSGIRIDFTKSPSWYFPVN